MIHLILLTDIPDKMENVFHLPTQLKLIKDYVQAFINYNFSYTRFRACKTVLGARPCTLEIVPVKEQTCTLLVIT